MIPNSGLTKILNMLASGMYLAVGTNDTAPAATDTALNTEIARSAVSLYNVVANTWVEYTAYFTAAQVGGQTIREVGVLDAVTGGTLLVRLIVSPGQAVSGVQGLVVQITVPIARG